MRQEEPSRSSETTELQQKLVGILTSPFDALKNIDLTANTSDAGFDAYLASKYFDGDAA